jgi:hypothetical protein
MEKIPPFSAGDGIFAVTVICGQKNDGTFAVT